MLRRDRAVRAAPTAEVAAAVARRLAGEPVLRLQSTGDTRMQGIPMGRRHRAQAAWYGDPDFTPHFKAFVRSGAIDVTVTFGNPAPLTPGSDRKAAARSLEATVRRPTAATLRGRDVLPAGAA